MLIIKKYAAFYIFNFFSFFLYWSENWQLFVVFPHHLLLFFIGMFFMTSLCFFTYRLFLFSSWWCGMLMWNHRTRLFLLFYLCLNSQDFDSLRLYKIVPSFVSSGISLTEEQWSTFKKNVPAIEKAIKKMESQMWECFLETDILQPFWNVIFKLIKWFGFWLWGIILVSWWYNILFRTWDAVMF